MKILMRAAAFLLVLCLLAGAVPCRVSAAEGKTGATVSSGQSVKTLKRGSRGSAVKELQKGLKTLGYYKAGLDGRFGPKTEKAIKKLQSSGGVAVTGKAGSTELKLIDRLLSEREERSVAAAAGEAVYYDIKLTRAQQDYVREMCRRYNTSFELVLAIMGAESGYKIKSISKTKDYGIMQINKSNHKYLKKKLGIKDFLDFRQNTRAGVYWLSRYAKKYSDVHKLLMCYNLGEGEAKKKWKKGVQTSSYSKKVVKKLNALKRI